MSARYPRPATVVVKVGSSSLTAPDGGLDLAAVATLSGQIAAARTAGTDIVLVSSGAVSAGLAPLGLDARPVDLPSLQAAASVGQGRLLHAYQESFAAAGVACGQVLLTPDDVVHRPRFLNARTTFARLLALKAVPLVNENDTVATDELRFGDNDRLAALVTSMVGAQLLVLLSDVEGLHDGDPRHGAALRDQVRHLDELDERHFGPSLSAVGTGGMASKIEAARIATFSGASTVIARAQRDRVVADVIAGAQVGTWFAPSPRPPESRKVWIAFAAPVRGSVRIDAGAVDALRSRGSSLLPAGVVDASGSFQPGDPVEVVDGDARLVARGLVGYGLKDLLSVRGQSSAAVSRRLGPQAPTEVIHRDQLVLL